MAKVIGFVGVEKYDLMLYMAQLLARNDSRLLLIDNSETQALRCSINYPAALNPRKTVVEYNGFHFMAGVSISGIDVDAAYDFILIDFGFCLNHPDILRCDTIEIFTNMRRHNILRLLTKNFVAAISKTTDDDKPETFLVFREWVPCKFSKSYMLEVLKGLGISQENTYQLDLNMDDYVSELLTQYDTVYQFKRVSAPVREYIMDTLVRVFGLQPELVKKLYKSFSGV